MSRSWRGVLRHLGLAATSASAIRSVRKRADQLGLDHDHFTGQRRWSDQQLEAAIASSRSWVEVADALGLAVGSSTTVLKGHAARLRIDATHFGRSQPRTDGKAPVPDVSRLPRAGSLLAAAWFSLCGYEVSWPLEPGRYDLLAHRGDEFLRVQVKTTRFFASDTWIVRVLSNGRPKLPYDPDDIDYFFIIDGDLCYYLIPVAVVGGRQGLNLRSYENFKVPRDPVSGGASPADAD